MEITIKFLDELLEKESKNFSAECEARQIAEVTHDYDGMFDADCGMIKSETRVELLVELKEYLEKK